MPRYNKMMLCLSALLILIAGLANAKEDIEHDELTEFYTAAEDKYRIGQVNWRDGDTIVIADTQYEITDETDIYDGEDSRVDGRYLEVGMWVVYRAEEEFNLSFVREAGGSAQDDGEEENEPGVASDEQQQNSDTAPAAAGSPDGIYQEGGVWKN